jgi:hypothetical protein
MYVSKTYVLLICEHMSPGISVDEMEMKP